ncbi:hypothetical protein DKX38_004652 [Salix brachista]|uniref:Rhamnogalacturonase A/B/Epimerase-like pectate lyase domain-containing protein n=1 Tax=Salix brachista TaxID=2182728 RepID=A0A5N5NC34_9ROSI|nr:hypothetical protein DKX38_004652 [Salix brachista]
MWVSTWTARNPRVIKFTSCSSPSCKCMIQDMDALELQICQPNPVNKNPKKPILVSFLLYSLFAFSLNFTKMPPFLLSLLLLFTISVPFSSCIAVGEVITCSGIVPMKYRNDKISIADFGGVGDGKTLNTKAFREAIYRIQHLRRRGGSLLYIPPGVYLTESFNLTSHMTLYLARGAVIKATQVIID